MYNACILSGLPCSELSAVATSSERFRDSGARGTNSVPLAATGRSELLPLELLMLVLLVLVLTAAPEAAALLAVDTERRARGLTRGRGSGGGDA